MEYVKKANVVIEATREGYGLDQCGQTMTVGELIDYLRQYDEDTPVFISNDNGYTYGPIMEGYIKEKEYEDEDADEEDESENESVNESVRKSLKN